MSLLRCTQKLLKEMGLRQSEFVKDESDASCLGSWYANLLVIERKKSVIFTNERTLLTFLRVGLKRSEILELWEVFRDGLADLLIMLAVEGADVSQILDEYGDIHFGRTADRSVLGSQNDLASMAQHKIAYDGGLQLVDLTAINVDLNQTPMSRLGMSSPRAALEAWLEGDPIPSAPRKKTPSSRKKKPERAAPDNVTITRQGNTAIIGCNDASIATTHLEVGPNLRSKNDDEVLALFNATIEARNRSAAQRPDVVREVPLGDSQIRYSERADQWTPHGSALRCVVGDKDGQAVIYIDDQELSLEEFGRLLTTYSGWGMRIEFMSEEGLDRRPPRVLIDSDDDEG